MLVLFCVCSKYISEIFVSFLSQKKNSVQQLSAIGWLHPRISSLSSNKVIPGAHKLLVIYLFIYCFIFIYYFEFFLFFFFFFFFLGGGVGGGGGGDLLQMSNLCV